MQGIVDGGAGGTGPAFVQRGPEFVDGGMVGMSQEVVEERDSLWRAAQAGGDQCFVDFAGGQLNCHLSKIRLSSNEVQG